MKLEVGMYVRTRFFGILKILKSDVDVFGEKTYVRSYVEVDKRLSMSNKLEKDGILKSSFNIIDLIEVGDYVNGCKVYKSNNVDGLFTNDNGWIMIIERINIKSILTHEQFEANAYTIEKERCNCEIIYKTK